MKIKNYIFSLLLLTFASVSLQAQINYLEQVESPFGLTSVAGGSASYLTLGDLDNDGDLDVLSGTLSSGFVYFENTGTTSLPAYGPQQLNPFGITDPSPSASNYAPNFIDIDNDGDLDIISSSNFGWFFYYENIGTPSLPAFGPVQQDPFGLVDGTFSLTQLTFADLDNDGDKDAIIAQSGNVYQYFQNVGTASAPSFAPKQAMTYGGSSFSNSGSITFSDIDGDGDLDLLKCLTSTNGNFHYYENIGTVTVPEFTNSQLNPFGLESINWGVGRAAFGDLDNDGDQDFLTGNNAGGIIYFERGIEVTANTAPTAICQNITVNLDENGEATITATQINNGSSDSDAGDTLTLSINNNTFDCSNVGANTVTLTVNDGNGGTDTCTATVTVNANNNCEPVIVTGQNVLIIKDESTTDVQALKTELEAAGHTVTLSATVEHQYDGTNPSLNTFDAVIHMNGAITSYSNAMPQAGQDALVDFVYNQGGVYTGYEWNAWEIDNSNGALNTMEALNLLVYDDFEYTTATYTVVTGQESHPILSGIPTSFSITSMGNNVGEVKIFTTDPSSVLMTSEYGAAVVVRDLSSGGKIVNFQHAATETEGLLANDANLLQLFVNAVGEGTPTINHPYHLRQHLDFLGKPSLQ